MEKEILQGIIEAFIQEYIKNAKSLFSDIFDRGKQFLNSGLKKYLEKHKNKYCQVKTLLHGNTPMYLYDIYYHLKLFHTPKVFSKTESVSQVFSDTRTYVTVIGEAGSGKSTLIRHLFLNSIYTKFAIPIIIELRSLNEKEGDIEKYIYETLLDEDIAVNQDILKALLKKGKFLFFLDGFDELHSRIKTHAIKNIQSFVNKYGANKFLVTSRPYADAEYLPHFHNLKLGKLDTLNEVFEFVNKQLPDEREIANKIIESIKFSNQKYIFSFLSNPLLLSLYILTFQTNSLIPAKKHIFYQRVINALFSEHDSRTKMAFDRERLSNLSQEQIEDVLSIFCLYSFFENKYEWDSEYVSSKFRDIKKLDSVKEVQFDSQKLIKDLVLGISLWIEDGSIYSFAHRTLQEFFVAKFIKNLKSNENEKFYALLISKYISHNNYPYLFSLLSFLEEMDTFNLNRNFRYPILLEIKQKLGSKVKDGQCVLYLDYFGYAIVKNEGSFFSKRRYRQNGYKFQEYLPFIKTAKSDIDIIMEDLASDSIFLNAVQENNSLIDKRMHKAISTGKVNRKKSEDEFISVKLKNICNDNILPKRELFLQKVNSEILKIEAYITHIEKTEYEILNFLKNKE